MSKKSLHRFQIGTSMLVHLNNFWHSWNEKVTLWNIFTATTIIKVALYVQLNTQLRRFELSVASLSSVVTTCVCAMCLHKTIIILCTRNPPWLYFNPAIGNWECRRKRRILWISGVKVRAEGAASNLENCVRVYLSVLIGLDNKTTYLCFSVISKCWDWDVCWEQDRKWKINKFHG